MNTDILEMLRTLAPEYVSIIIIIITIAYIAGLVRNAFQGLPSLMQFRPGYIKRAFQREEMAFVIEQLSDPTLPEKSRAFLEVRRAELVVSLARGIDLPLNLQEHLIELSTDKNEDGVNWWLFREIQRKLVLRDGKVIVTTNRNFLLNFGFLSIGIIILFYYGGQLFFLFATGNLGTLDNATMLNQIASILIGIYMIRSTITDILGVYVSNRIDVLYQNAQDKLKDKTDSKIEGQAFEINPDNLAVPSTTISSLQTDIEDG